MADVRPTLSEVISRMESDAAAALPGVDVSLPRSLLSVLLRSWAGGTYEAWGHLQAIANDSIPDTATSDALERWSSLFGVNRVQGVKAIGTVFFTADPAWVPVAIGARLVRADGFEYVVSGAPFFSGAWLANVRAVNHGTSGNYSGVMRLIEPSVGIGDVTTVGSIQFGVDRETDEALRARFLDVLRAPPQGGTAADFKRWALAVAGVTRAWVLAPSPGSPTFAIHIANDALLPAAPTASGATVTAAQAEIDALKPITSDPVVQAAAFVAIDPEITLTPNDAATQAAVSAEITAMLDRQAGPGVTITLSKLQTAVAGAPGIVDFTITVPASDFTPGGANVAYLGTPVYS